MLRWSALTLWTACVACVMVLVQACTSNMQRGATLWTACLTCVTLLGDAAVQACTSDMQRAAADNLTHGLIGLLTWVIVLAGSKVDTAQRYGEILVCGLLSSAVDVDHFIAARSFSLQAARQLPTRPFFHCTSVPLVLCCVVLLLAHLSRCCWLHRAAWLLAAAVVSHHTRDATRRGFWLWPLGSSPALPHVLYVASIAALPHLIRHGLALTAPAQGHRTFVELV